MVGISSPVAAVAETLVKTLGLVEFAPIISDYFVGDIDNLRWISNAQLRLVEAAP